MSEWVERNRGICRYEDALRGIEGHSVQETAIGPFFCGTILPRNQNARPPGERRNYWRNIGNQ